MAEHEGVRDAQRSHAEGRSAVVAPTAMFGSDPPTTDGLATAPVSSRLARHVAGLALILVVLLVPLGGAGLYSADEGAAVAQAHLLVDEGTWSFEVPRPDLDPERRLRPFDLSDELTGAPFAKHPAFPVLLMPFVAVGGATGAKLLSVLGAVAAAAVAAGIARRLDPRLDRAALWVVGLGSPLFFDSFIVIAHTLAAALCGWAALVVSDQLALASPGGEVDGERGQRFGRSNVSAALQIAGAVLVATLLRNEAVLFGVALGIAVGISAVRRRSLGHGRLAAGAFAAAVGGYVLDTILTRLVASPDTFVVGETLGSSNYLVDRIAPTLETLFLATRGSAGVHDLVVMLALCAAVIAAMLARRDEPDPQGVVLLAVLAAAAGAYRMTGPPSTIPGLFASFPVLAAGLMALGRQRLRQPVPALLATTSVLFVGAVLATQYEAGGTAEWGFRYAAVALPLLVPLALVGLLDVGSRLDRTAARRAGAALVVLCASLSVLALRAIEYQHDVGSEVLVTVEEVRSRSDRPVVVTSFAPLGRIAWEQILDGQDWVLIEEGEVDELADVFADRMADDGGDVVMVTRDADEDLAPFDDTHEVVERVPALSTGELDVVRLAVR